MIIRVITAFFCFVCISVLCGLFSGFIFGKLNPILAITSLYIGLAISLKIIFKTNLKFKLDFKNQSLISKLVLLFSLFFSLRAFLWIFYKVGDDLRVLSPNNLGDISLHINYIQYLAKGAVFWPDNSIFYGDKIRYPIGIDLFNSLLVLSGFDLQKSLVWVGLICSISIMLMIFIWGNTFTLAGFLFNGGLLGFKFFNGLQFFDYQKDSAWKNIFLSVCITQRGVLYSIPVGLILLNSWRQRFFNKDAEKYNLVLPLWLEILFYTSMPFFHVHTFIFLTIILIWFFIISTKNRSHILKLAGFSIPLSTFIILLITNNFKSSSIIHFKLGWMQEKTDFISFWGLNFGIFLPLALFLFFKLSASRATKTSNQNNLSEVESFIYIGVLTMILFFNVMFAPWEWDNIKLLLWSYLIILPYLWEGLISNLDKIKKCVICFLLFFSGFVCVCGGFPRDVGFNVFRYSETLEVEGALENIDVNSRFAAFPTWGHPLSYCGRKLALGYPGWLWSHGYKVDSADKVLMLIMMGDKNWLKYAHQMDIRYIFWGSREELNYKGSLKPWESQLKPVLEGNWGKLFDLQKIK